MSEDGDTVYVVNHHGSIDNAKFKQHGGRGQVAVLDVNAVLDPRNDKTANALQQHLDSGGFGAIGVVLLPDMLVISNAENNLTEDAAIASRLWIAGRAACGERWSWRWGHRASSAITPCPYVAPFGPPKTWR